MSYIFIQLYTRMFWIGRTQTEQWRDQMKSEVWWKMRRRVERAGALTNEIYQRPTFTHSVAKGEFSLKTLRRRRQFHNPWEIFQIYIISITHPSAIDTKRFTFWRRPIAKNKKTASARSYCKTRQTQTVDSPEMDGMKVSKSRGPSTAAAQVHCTSTISPHCRLS